MGLPSKLGPEDHGIHKSKGPALVNLNKQTFLLTMSKSRGTHKVLQGVHYSFMLEGNKMGPKVAKVDIPAEEDIHDPESPKKFH